MKQEEKQLLLQDLCARLPYGVKCYIKFDDGKIFNERILAPIMIQDFKEHSFVSFIPYLRPMSSMTDEEKSEFYGTFDPTLEEPYYRAKVSSFDWLNKHHFDYRGLIEKGLALEASKEMYEY